MKGQLLPNGVMVSWCGGEVVVGVMPMISYLLVRENLLAKRWWWARGVAGRFLGFRVRRFVVSGWLA